MILYLMKKRIYILLLLVFLLFGSLFVRLGYVTFYMSNKINVLANDLWSREIPSNSGRGKIYDRNGEIIVGNSLSLSLASINTQIENKETCATLISEILDVKFEKIYNHLIKKNSVEMIKPEGRKLSLEKARKIIDLNIDGLYVVSDTSRYYPYQEMLGATLGFVGVDNDGLSGLEYLYNDYLKSSNGSLNIYTDAKGNLMPNMISYFKGSKPGYDLYLTIDLEIQKIMDNVIENAIVKYNPDKVMGIIMNAKSGEILSLSSYPSFNPTYYQDYDSEIYNRNLPIWMSFEPGSTFKIVTYSAGLEENVFNLNDPFFCSGYRIVGDRRIKDWKAGGHGSETFLDVIENSCNPGFMEIGERLGVDKFYNYLKDFGFGEKTGIDLIGESSGILFNKENMGPVELATSSFGQGNSTTPIQLVTSASAAVNGGELLTPYILKYIGNSSNDILYENEKVVRRKVISEETSSIVRYALESVVARGTGRSAYVDGYRIGGKTGTAQKISDDGGYLKNNYILSFLGIAPMNDPEVVCYLAIDNPKNTIQYGGVVAAPLVGNILSQVLPYLGVKKDLKNQIEMETRYYIDPFYYVVPNLIGTLKSKINYSGNYNYVFQGEGNKVIDQSPSPGDKIIEGGTIILYLGE